MRGDSDDLQFDFTAGRSKSIRQVRVLREFHAYRLSPEESVAIVLAVLRVRLGSMQQEITNMVAIIDGILDALREGGATELQLEIWKECLYELQRDTRLSVMSQSKI